MEKIKRLFEEYCNQYPDQELIEIEYNGSDDSFEGFDNNDTDFEDLAYAIFEELNADFNNEGSKGTITIDVVNKNLKFDNYYIVYSEELNCEKEIQL